MRLSLFRRLLLAMCGITAASLVLVLLLQERSLAGRLQQAAESRLSTASTAAQRLLDAHLETMGSRWEVVSRTPQLRATLEIDDAPTLEHYAESLRAQHAAARVAFVDATSGRVLAGAGDADLDREALAIDGRGVVAVAGRAHVVATTTLANAGRLLAVEPIGDALLADWSALCGARVEFATPGTRGAELVEPIRRIGPLEMRVSTSLEAEREAVRSARLGLATAAAFALAAAFGVSLLVSRGLVRPIERLRVAAERIGAGDLTATVDVDRNDEIGATARAFDQMVRDLRETILSTVQSAGRVDRAARVIGAGADRFRALNRAQQEHNETTARSLAEIHDQMQAIATAAADSSRQLDASIDGSSASFRELEDSGRHLQACARQLQERTEEITDAIRDVAVSAEQIARDTASLLPAVDDTSQGVSDLSASARAVSEHVDETARLSNAVIENADDGRRTMQHAVDGMRSTQETIRDCERVVQELSQQVNQIGLVLTVIDDVTEETNLLALNGSIVASQAGEQGRAFAVVAEQLRALAERVQSGTKEIDALVRAVQTESSNAVVSIGRGAARAEAGVELIAQAEAALTRIASSARESGKRMAESAAATAQQLELATAVTRRMSGVREGIERIRTATREQAGSHTAVQATGEALEQVQRDVQRAVEIQTRGANRIGASVGTVQQVVREITSGLETQISAGERVSEEVHGATQHAQTHESAAGDIEDAARELEREADTLRRAVARFRGGDGES